MGQFQGTGRYKQDRQGQTQPLFGYLGSADGNAIDAGIGGWNDEHLQIMQANGRIGGWNTENGFQIGAEGQASMFGFGGTFGDAASIFGVDVTDSSQGGWENFVSGEAHGPSVNANAQAGTDGISAGATAELTGFSGKVGGAEYDSFLGGTEITGGFGIGGVGASAGLCWSDDDGDGLRELGFSLGGETGLGFDVGIKTEALGHAANAISGAWDWLTAEQ